MDEGKVSDLIEKGLLMTPVEISENTTNTQNNEAVLQEGEQ